jgi:hypothetical protein
MVRPLFSHLDRLFPEERAELDNALARLQTLDRPEPARPDDRPLRWWLAQQSKLPTKPVQRHRAQTQLEADFRRRYPNYDLGKLSRPITDGQPMTALEFRTWLEFHGSPVPKPQRGKPPQAVWKTWSHDEAMAFFVYRAKIVLNENQKKPQRVGWVSLGAAVGEDGNQLYPGYHDRDTMADIAEHHGITKEEIRRNALTS